MVCLVYFTSNDDLWLTSPWWEEELGWRGLWSTLFIGLVWYVLQAMTTSDLPLLGEKKSGDGEHCEAHFGLVWFGIFYKEWRPLTYLSLVRRRAGMASIDLFWFGLVFPPSNDDLWLTSPWLVWFGFSSRQCRPLTYLFLVRRRAGMART